MLTANGKMVPLHARAFDLLALLVANRDRAVERDEIFAQVFQGQARSRGNIPTQVHNLRKAIEGAGGSGALIQTVGEAYRFIGDIVPPVASATPALADISPRAATFRVGQGCALTISVTVALLLVLAWSFRGRLRPGEVAAAPPLSIAVIPFEYRGSDTSHAYLADAITDDLVSDLSRIPLSKVSARQSTNAVKTETPQAIGAALAVQYIIVGSVTQEDGGYEIAVNLLDARTGAVLKALNFSRSDDRMATVQRDIVRTIAGPLHFTLDAIEGKKSAQDRSENEGARDDFFRARSRLDSGDNLADLTDAQVYLQQAITKQPDFADAWAELAWTLLRKTTGLDDPTEAQDFAAAQAAAAKALAIAPDNPTALAARAKILRTEGKCDEARSFANQVIAVQDSNMRARAVLAACAMTEGRLEDAAAQYEALLRLNPAGPGNGGMLGALGYLRLIDGHYAEAAELLTRSIDVNEKPDPYEGMNPLEQARLGLIAAYALLGQHDRADQAFQAYNRDWPNRSVWRVRAYLPKNWLSQSGMGKALQALQSAGMPEFTRADPPGLADGAMCQSGDFAPTPRNLDGGGVVTTPELVRDEVAQEKPLIIDVGRGAAVIADAAWWNPTSTTQTESDFAEAQAAKLAPAIKNAHIVVAGDGAFGCGAYNAARRLIISGYKNVFWYRGGEEAWRSNSQPSVDKRPF